MGKTGKPVVAKNELISKVKVGESVTVEVQKISAGTDEKNDGG